MEAARRGPLVVIAGRRMTIDEAIERLERGERLRLVASERTGLAAAPVLRDQAPLPRAAGWTRAQRRRAWKARIAATVVMVTAVVVWGLAAYGFLAWWRS